MTFKFARLLPFTASLAFAAILTGQALAVDRRDSQDCEQTADFDRKISGCTRILESKNPSAEFREFGYNNRGIGFANKGDLDRAMADFSDALRVNPRSVRAHNNRAFAYYNKGDYDRTLDEANAALKIDPKSAIAHDNRGLAYFRKGDSDRALAEFDMAVLLDPKDDTPVADRGGIYAQRGDYDRALSDSNAAIAINPENQTAWMVRARAYGVKGEVQRSIASYDEVIRLAPKNGPAYLRRAEGHSAKGDYDKAITDYGEAARLDPLDPEPLTGRALVHEKRSEIAKAKEDFNAALKLSPRSDTEKSAQDKARERLAALSATPDSSAPSAASAPSTTAVAAIAAPIAVGDRRIALVIGNSAYLHAPALSNPERDAALVADVLKRTGFETVTVQSNLRKDAMIAALRDFAARAESADWAVVYYAGHGMEVGGTNYLIPIDATIASDRDIGFEAVPLEQVLNAAERARKLRLVVLDACRDNPFANGMKRTLTVASRSVTRGLAAVEPEAGTLVIYAAKDGQTANDGDGNNSPFALAFAKNMQTPGLEVRRLFDYVRDDVMDATARKQQPFSYGSISGRQDFYFVAGK